MAKLEWNVFVHNFNGKGIEKYNILGGFMLSELVRIKKKCKKDGVENFEVFSSEVKSTIMRHYWSRSEWEVIITSWPPHIDKNELDRLVKEKENVKYCAYVNLDVERKVDVYEQIMLNWDVFINYLWDNRKDIK